jgi:hypothetical protein
MLSADNNARLVELPSLEYPTAWNDPMLFDDCETPDISAQCLPGVLREFASAVAQATETPEALSVMTILGVISTIFTQQFTVCPKEGWYEPVNIYTLIALPPANHKSLVLNYCTRPLVDWEKEQGLQQGLKIKCQRSERKTQEKIIETLRAKAAKSTDTLEQQQLINDVIQKEAILAEIPVLPILFTNDATPESLASLIHEQDGRLAIFSDEGGILETLAGLYSHGDANVDVLLKGIDGGEVRVCRKDRSFTLNPFLTIVLTVQPAIIQNMGKKRAYLGNGTLERFLYVLPKSKLGYRTHDQPPISQIVLNAYHAKITSLLNEFFLKDKDKHHPADRITLSTEAYATWRDFQATIEVQLRPDGKLASCQGWGGKICGFALRIAGLLHVAEYGANSLVLGEATMRNALTIVDALVEHAIAAFGLMGIDQATEDAKAIFSWIKARSEPTFTQSDVVFAMRNKKLGKSERLVKALSLLNERNIISAPIRLLTRKPTTIYYVNPILLTKE